MSAVVRFQRLIDKGANTKTQLIASLNQIQVLDSSSPYEILLPGEYDEILALINASNLPD